MTKFLGIEVKSRPYGCKAGIEVPGQGGVRRDPTGPAGWSWELPPSPSAPELHNPPTPAPAGLPGPAALVVDLSPGSWLGTGITPPDHPVYPPCIPTRYRPPLPHGSHVTAGTVSGARGTCTYDRFWRVVGEPRGSRTHPVLTLLGTVWHCWHCIGTLHLIMTVFY